MKNQLVYTTGTRSKITKIANRLTILKAENELILKDNQQFMQEINAQLSSK